MTLRTATGSVLLSVGALFLFYSCSSNPAGNNTPPAKSTLTAQEHDDLVKMANTITKILPISDPTTQSSLGNEMSKKKSDSEEGCDFSTPGMIICNYLNDDGYGIDTTWTYTDAAKTVLASDAMSLTPGSYYYMVMHMVAHDSQTDCDIVMNTSYREIDYTQLSFDDTSDAAVIELYNSMDMKADFKGTLNYYNDDLMLEFYDTKYQMKNGIISGDYKFKIMAGKYDVTMHFEMSILTAFDENGTDEPSMQGPITNQSGEQIGVFTVNNNDGSVKIYDNQGNLVKTAG